MSVSNPASSLLFDIILGLARLGKEIQPPRIKPPSCTAITHSNWWAVLFEIFPGNNILWSEFWVYRYQAWRETNTVTVQFWVYRYQAWRETNTVTVQKHQLILFSVIFFEAFNLYLTEQVNVQFGESYHVKINKMWAIVLLQMNDKILSKRVCIS